MRPLLIVQILAQVVISFSLCTSVSADQEPAAGWIADILLRNGTLHLGDGKPAHEGDIAIVGDRIVGVGNFKAGEVGRVIDCTGKVISPGFIDLHNHSDDPMIDQLTRAVTNFVTQGCTTVVTGNCGLGPWNVGKFYHDIDTLGAGVNIAHLLPHGELRREVMQSENREPTPRELQRLKELTRRAMEDGAWGMSTGLVYEPSSYAKIDELVELTRIVGRHGGIYASHIRNENVRLLEAVEEALEIGLRANTPVHVSHFKCMGTASWGLVRKAAEMIEKRRAAGERITADQYPYTASSTTLEATVIPDWAFAGGWDALLARFDSDAEWPKVREAMAAKLATLEGGQLLQIASHAPQPTWAGRRLAEIAKELQIDPIDLVVKMTRDGGAMVVNHSMNEDDVRYVMQLPWVATASDGHAFVPDGSVPHPRNYGTFPRKIGHYACREKVVTVEQAIRSSTGLPADIVGLKDRGYLRVGYKADIVVWDSRSIIDTATFAHPHSYSAGVEHVLVNGKPALVDGKATGALAGRALRRPKHDKSGSPGK